jgi:sugar lactone lactonase YvrE
MKRLVITLVLAGVLLTALAAPAGAASATSLSPSTLTTFSPGLYGAFAESMAADSHGNLFVSLTTWGYASEDGSVNDSNIGEIWKVAPDGKKTLLARMEELSPYGVFTGVALDSCDRVYVAAYDFSADYGLPESLGSGIFRLDAGGILTRVALLPPGSFPNGLAFHKGSLYISDSGVGVIWRVRVDEGVATPASSWFQNALLAPSKTIGVNGIAFKGDTLYAVVYDVGRVVRIPVNRDGTPGTPNVLCKRPQLRTADGIAFDILGRLWIVTNGTPATPSGGLYRVSTTGVVTKIFDDPGWLNYPVMPVFGRTAATATTLFVENGAYNGWFDGTSPDIISLQVGVPGLPLW